MTNASTGDGGPVALWDYYSGSNQQWTLQATDSGFFKVLAKHSGKALEVADAGTANQSLVQQWTYVGGAQQQWKLEDLGNGSYELAPRHAPGMRLEVRSGTTTNGTPIQISSDNNSCAQRWVLKSTGVADPVTTVQVNATGASAAGDYVSLPSNGATASLVVPTNAPGAVSLKVRASGDLYGSEFPKVELRRGTTVLRSFQINSGTGQLYDLGSIGVTPGETLSLVFVNDAYGGGYPNDRNAYVDYGEFSWGTGTSPTPTDLYSTPDPSTAVNVTTFSAYQVNPNDQYDDTDNIQEVINRYTVGKNIYFPAGTYYIKHPIYLDNLNNQTVFGAPGAKFVIANWNNSSDGGENAVFTFRNPTNVMIRDLTIEGYVNTTLNIYGVNHMSAVSVFGPRGFTAYKLNVSRVQSYGVFCRDGGNFKVIDSKFSYIHGSSIIGRTCDDVVVKNNYAEGTADPAQAPNRLKFVDSNDPNADSYKNAPNTTGGIGIFFQMGDRILIENNTIKNQWDTATKTEGSDDVIYRGNTVDTFGKDGIKIMYIPEGQASDRQVPVIQVANGVIENNIVRNFMKWKWDGSGGYVVQGVKGGRLTNNTFYGPGLSYENKGMTISSNGTGVPQPQDIIIEDNVMYDTYLGINNETATGSIIRRNKFLSSNGAVNTSSCIWVGRGDGTIVENNSCQKFSSNGLWTYDYSGVNGAANLIFQGNQLLDGSTGISVNNSKRATIKVLSNSFTRVQTPLKLNGAVAECSGNTSNGVQITTCP